MDLLFLIVPATSKVVESTDRKAVVGENRTKKQMVANQMNWRPLDVRAKLHLELVARLLKCAQRLYICRVSWDNLPEDFLDVSVDNAGSFEDCVTPEIAEHPQLSSEDLAQAPWLKLVAGGLISSSRAETLSASTDKHLCSALELVQKENGYIDSPIPYLAIVAASCECFPAGQCWVSSASDSWRFLPPDNKLGSDIIRYQCASTNDLILLVSLLQHLLAFHGRPDCDPSVQYWILFSLIKVTETTAVLLENEKVDPPSCRAVAASWRIVWKTLFQPDLRYAEYTSIASENSIGEMVLILLTEMIRCGCTDSVGGKQKIQFVYENQHNIWHLPLFKGKIDITLGSRAPFELISSILQFVGLSESQGREVSKMFPSNARSLRHCLVVQSLCCMNDAMITTNKSFSEDTSRRALVSAIAKCLLGLSTGEFLQLNHLSSQDARFETALDSDFAISSDTNIHHFDSSGSKNINTTCLNILWNPSAR